MSKQRFNYEHVPMPKYPRSLFDISQGHDTTISGGYLYPLYHEEVLPGDTFQMNASLFARMATPIKPFLTNVYMNVQFYFVPNRLVWQHWVNMMGERKNPDDSIDYSIPTVTVPDGGFTVGSLMDYIGYPVGKEPYVDTVNDNDGAWSALPLRAYNLIWNEYYRDENLQDSVFQTDGDGPDTITDSSTGATNYGLLRRGKRKDYFTGAYPEPQKGDPPLLNIGGSAPVNIGPIAADGNLSFTGWTRPSSSSSRVLFGAAGERPSPSQDLHGYSLVPYSDNSLIRFEGDMGVVQYNSGLKLTKSDGADSFVADLSSASGINVNDLRFLFQMQRLLERDMLGGTRYVSWLRSQFGVISPDYRNYRPEFLGGATYRLNVNPVVQTSNTGTQTTPQGNLSAFALVAGSSRFTKTFTEHGQILGLVCIYADKYYCQGIHRKFTRRGRYDFALPVLAHIGMQSIKNRELFISETDFDNEAYGYTYMYDEYRTGYNRVSGLMRADAPNNVSDWTIQEKYQSTPLLNSSFIEENPPFANVVAVQDEPTFYFDGYFKVKVARELPVYGFPGLIDHG